MPCLRRRGAVACVARTFAYFRPRSRALAAAIGAAEAARMAPAVQVPFCGVGDYSARAAADGRSTLAVELLCEVGRIPRRTPRVETLCVKVGRPQRAFATFAAIRPA